MWSFLDVFEFLTGYQSGFGLYHVDFTDAELKRQPKLSAHWYANLLLKDTDSHIQQRAGQKAMREM